MAHPDLHSRLRKTRLMVKLIYNAPTKIRRAGTETKKQEGKLSLNNKPLHPEKVGSGLFISIQVGDVDRFAISRRNSPKGSIASNFSKEFQEKNLEKQSQFPEGFHRLKRNGLYVLAKIENKSQFPEGFHRLKLFKFNEPIDSISRNSPKGSIASNFSNIL